MPLSYPDGWEETFRRLFDRDYLPVLKEKFEVNDLELVMEELDPADFGRGHHVTLDCQLETSDFTDEDYLNGDEDKTRVAGFRIVSMPGCCGIAISTGSWVHMSFRNRGIGGLLNKSRIQLGKILNFGAMICTDVSKNEPSRKLLEKNGWKDVFKFKNPRTRNEVFLSVIPLEGD